MPSVHSGPGMRIAAALFAALLCRGVMAQTEIRTPQADDAKSQKEGLGFSLSTGASFSDNILREPANEEDGTIARAGVTLGYETHTRRIDANVDIDTMFDHYLDDSFEDGVVGGVNAKLDFAFVPERFTWSFVENFGQLTSDPFAADTPENRENISYFTTGPQFEQPLGDSFSLILSGRLSDAQYEVSNLDNRETGGSLSLAKKLSSAGQLSLVADVSRLEFDDAVANTDYDRTEVYLLYDLQGSRTDLSLEGGTTTLDIEGEKSSGLLAKINLVRRLSRSARLTVGGGSQFSNSGDLFRDGQNYFGVNPDVSDVTGSGDPFERQFGQLAFDFDRNRTSLGVSVMTSQESYETETDLDRQITNWNGYLRRSLSGTMQVALFVGFEQQSYDNISFDVDELRAGVSLDWSFARTLGLRLDYMRFDRDTSTGESDYAENQASLFLVWSPVRQR